MSDRKIKISLIDIPPNRLRDADPGQAQCLAAMFKEVGHLTPIDVVAAGKRYRLVAGLQRLAAAKIAKWREIDARVLDPAGRQPAQDLRLHEILENLARKDLNALERCTALYELKQVHEVLFPETRNGGDRRSQAARHKQGNQMAIFAFCSSAAETTGLSERSVRLAIQIFEDLSPDSRVRLKGTAYAEKQADLKALSELDPETQAKVLDVLLAEGSTLHTIADALLKVTGGQPDRPSDKLLKRAADILAGASTAGRMAIFRLHREEITDLVRKEGWLDGA